jgi:type 1 glutamine amidotransferase
MIVFARRMTLPEEHMKTIRAHWEAGKPVIGIRTASHAWGADDNAVFDRRVLGNHYQGHYRDERTVVTNVAAQNSHPVLNGVHPFTSRRLYKAGELAPTATALQIGDKGEGRHVVTLVNEYKGGRMFYTSLGVPEDFRDQNFRRMLMNAIYWCTRTAPTTKRDGRAAAGDSTRDRDYLTCPEEEVRQIAPLRTVLGGRTVFRKQGS